MGVKINEDFVIDFLVARASAKVSGDVSDILEKRGIDWNMLTDAYNIVAPVESQHDYETLQTLIFSGDITLKELTIVWSVLSSKPLFTFAPLTEYDKMQAKGWAKG